MKIVKPMSSILVNTDHQFLVNFKSIGSPSCSAVNYISSEIEYSIGSFGDSTLCSTLFPTIKYIENYDLSLPESWNFTAKFITTGIIELRIRVRNQFQSIFLSEFITVVLRQDKCELPYVDIINKASLFYEPKRQKISELLAIKSDTRVNCSIGSRNIKEWKIYRVDKINGQTGQLVNLIDNPTVNYAELVVQPNTLDLGLYKITYRISMLFDLAFTSQSETFIEIIPSGIMILSLVGQFGFGIFEITRGFNQRIVFNPVLYSIDLDKKVKMSSLNFEFYCKLIEDETELDYPRLGNSEMTDLLTIKRFHETESRIRDLIYNNSLSCFNSVDNFEFDSTGNVMTVKARGLQYVKNRKYEVLIKANHLGYEYSSKIRIEISNNFVPIITIR